MRDDDIPVKTHEGTAEIKTRAAGLTPRERTALLLVDGVKPVAELLRVMAAAGVKPGTLELLLEKGLIRIPQIESRSAATPEPAPEPAPEVVPEPASEPASSSESAPASEPAPVFEPEPVSVKAPSVAVKSTPAPEAQGPVPGPPIDMMLMVVRAHLASALDDHIEGYALKQMVMSCTSRAQIKSLFDSVEQMLVKLSGKPASAKVMEAAQALLDSVEAGRIAK